MGESNPRSPRWAAIALVPAATFALLGAVDLAFRALADTEHWIAAGARLTDLSDHADEAFAYLIEQDAVTWDPSNGTRMDEVLAHLRPGEGERVLLLGSSQLLTLRDDRRLAAYAKRADKVLERIAPHSASVYNLSVGAMTAPEKALVLDRALGLEPFDHVLVCLNPWDSRQATVRPALAAIPERVERAGPASWLDGIPRIAPAMQRVLRDTLDAHIGFFARREAIRAWIHSLGRAQDTAEVRLLDRGRPVEYRWDATEQRDVEQNALELVAHLAGRAREHGFRGWIVLMPRRPDDEHPLYEPGFERRFSTIVAAASAHEGIF